VRDLLAGRDSLSPGGVDAVYAPPRPEWVRANFVAGLDGAASAGGRSRGLQVPGDLEVFLALRGLADVVLLGAGTARIENPTLERVGDAAFLFI